MAEPTVPTARVHQPSVQRHLARRLRGAASAPWLHTEIARRMAERLDVIKTQPRHIIDWWSTLGGSAALLKARYPAAQLTPVEPAACIDQLAVPRQPWWQRLGRNAPVQPLADNGNLPPAEAADLLWANMMLHWVDDLAPLLQRWHGSSATDGFLMFSCIGPDTLRELRAVYDGLGWPAPASRFIDMHDLGDELVHAGFADPVMDMELLTLTWPDAPALLAELRELGGNTAPQRPPGLKGRGWQQHLHRALTERLADGQGRLRLTVEVVYGHAFKPAPRARVSEHTEISLDSMRNMIRQRGKPPGHSTT